MSYNAMVLLLLQLDVIGTLLQTLIQVPTSFICNRTDEKLWEYAPDAYRNRLTTL